MKYKSKIDWWAHLVLAIMPIINIWLLIVFIQQNDLVFLITVIIFLLMNIFLILPIWLNTCYILEENELVVKCGLGKGKRIAYESIKSIKDSKNPLASAALSIDRIEITFGAGGIVLISPKEKQDFLQQLELRRR